MDEWDRMHEEEKRLHHMRANLNQLFKRASEKHRVILKSNDPNPFSLEEMNHLGEVYSEKKCTFLVCSPEVIVYLIEKIDGFVEDKSCIMYGGTSIFYAGTLHSKTKCFVDAYGYQWHVLLGYGIEDVDEMIKLFEKSVISHDDLDKLYPNLAMVSVKELIHPSEEK